MIPTTAAKETRNGFLFAKNAKQRVATVGALLTIGMMLLLSAGCAAAGWQSAIWAVLSGLVAALIFKGFALGYWMARFLFGLAAIACVCGGVNAFACIAAREALAPHAPIAIGSVAAGVMFLFLYHFLGEHAGLRGITREECWFPWVSTRVLFWVMVVVLVLSLLVTVPVITVH